MLLTLTQTEHPLFVLGRGWTGIERLTVGDALATRAGPALVVQSITNQHRAEGYLVYNLTVDGDHTYFVGKANGGVWAHNTGPCNFEDINDSKSLWQYLRGNFTRHNSESFASGDEIRDVERLVKDYKGAAKNWRKMKNFISHTDPSNATRIEIHWYENLIDGIGRREFKSKLP